MPILTLCQYVFFLFQGQGSAGARGRESVCREGGGFLILLDGEATLAVAMPFAMKIGPNCFPLGNYLCNHSRSDGMYCG